MDELFCLKSRKEIAENSTQISQLTSQTPITAVDATFPIDLNNQPYLSALIISADATARTVPLSNVPMHCVLEIELQYTTAAAITLFSGISWLNGTPLFTEGQTYRMVFWTHDGGTNWDGLCAGGWA